MKIFWIALAAIALISGTAYIAYQAGNKAIASYCDNTTAEAAATINKKPDKPIAKKKSAPISAPVDTFPLPSGQSKVFGKFFISRNADDFRFTKESGLISKATLKAGQQIIISHGRETFIFRRLSESVVQLVDGNRKAPLGIRGFSKH